MSKGFTWKLGGLVLLCGVTMAAASCSTARARIGPAGSVEAPDEFPAASPGSVTPAPPPQIQAP